MFFKVQTSPVHKPGKKACVFAFNKQAFNFIEQVSENAERVKIHTNKATITIANIIQ